MTMFKYDDLGTNLKALINSRENLNEAKLSRELNIPQPTLHRLVHGTTTNPTVSTLLPIATYFNISLDQLLGQSPLCLNQDQHSKRSSKTEVPILPWERVHCHEQLVPTLSYDNWQDWVTTDLTLNPMSFAFRVNGKTMPLPYEFDSIHIVEIGVDLKSMDGKIALMCSISKSAAYLRKIVRDGSDIWLFPIDSRLPPEKFDTSWTSFGMVRQHILTVPRDKTTERVE